MPGKCRRVDAPVHEDVDDELGRFTRRHTDSTFHSGTFVGKQRRRNRELDGLAVFAIEILGEARSQPIYPARSEPAERASDTMRSPETGDEDHFGDGIVGKSEQSWMQGGFVAQHT